MAEISNLLITDYPFWTLSVHMNQCYLGRAVVWLKRPGEMQRLTQLRNAENTSLFTIMSAYEKALDEWSSPSHVNYAWLGNDFAHHGGHGHMHLIPRYSGPRTFGGRQFVDERWGKNYVPYPEVTYPDVVLFAVRDVLREKMGVKSVVSRDAYPPST